MGFLRHIFGLANFLQLPRQHRKLVFYSEGKNYWVHLEAIIVEILAHTDLPVCYISSGDDDPGLLLAHDNFQAFKTDEGWIRDWLFQNIDTDILVMSMPDLDQYQVKRSRFPVHYIYVQHSLVSLHMAYRIGAFDCFDTVFCAGPHHVKEVRCLEEKYDLHKKVIVEHGYGRLDAIIAKAATEENTGKKITGERTLNSPTHVLIAPSWGESCTIEMCGEEIVELLLRAGFKVTLRPHPQTLKFSRGKVEAIVARQGANPLFTFESSAAGQDSLHQSDIMISDWSGAAFDYAFGLAKPVIFIDVPRKVNNPDYAEIPIDPFEALARSEIGTVCGIDALDTLPDKINATLATPRDELRELLCSKRELSVFNVGSSHWVARDYIQTLSSTLSGGR